MCAPQVHFTFWAEWWGFVTEVMLSAPFALFSLWGITVGARSREAPAVPPAAARLAAPYGLSAALPCALTSTVFARPPLPHGAGLLPKLCRETVGWLWPDTSRRTRFLRMQRNQKGASEQTRNLLSNKPRDSQWQQGDAEMGSMPGGRKPSVLIASENHGFAFSQNDPASAAIGALLTSTPREPNSFGSTAVTVEAMSPR